MAQITQVIYLRPPNNMVTVIITRGKRAHVYERVSTASVDRLHNCLSDINVYGNTCIHSGQRHIVWTADIFPPR